jgi:hypothetical protein
MMTAVYDRGQMPAALRETPGFGPEQLSDAVSREDPAAGEHAGPHMLLCRACRGAVTGAGERIVVQGSHAHTCANPAGLLFRIGCFRAAVCGYAGEPTYDWSWFRGMCWQVAVCRYCGAHLGWRFAGAGSEFHGLILDRLCGGGGYG